jgi:hypothetical protein
MADNQLNEHSYSSIDVLVDGEKLKSVPEIVVLPADEFETLKLGWVVYEEVEESFITKSAMNILNGHKLVHCTIVE